MAQRLSATRGKPADTTSVEDFMLLESDQWDAVLSRITGTVPNNQFCCRVMARLRQLL